MTTIVDPDLEVISKQLVQTNATLAQIRGYLGFIILSFLVVAALVIAGVIKLQVEIGGR